MDAIGILLVDLEDLTDVAVLPVGGAYNGHPVYLYQGDQKAGDTNGQGLTAFGGGWFALSSAGDQVTSQPSSSSGGGLGY